MRPGRISKQNIVEKEIVKLLMDKPNTPPIELHFGAIYTQLHERKIVTSYSPLSKALQSLVARGVLRTRRAKGGSISKKFYSLRNVEKTFFDIDREDIADYMAHLPIYFSEQAQPEDPAFENPPMDMNPERKFTTWTYGIPGCGMGPCYVMHLLLDEEFNAFTLNETSPLLINLRNFANDLFWHFLHINSSLNTSAPNGVGKDATAKEKESWVKKAFGFRVLLSLKIDGKQFLNTMNWKNFQNYAASQTGPERTNLRACATNMRIETPPGVRASRRVIRLSTNTKQRG